MDDAKELERLSSNYFPFLEPSEQKQIVALLSAKDKGSKAYLDAKKDLLTTVKNILKEASSFPPGSAKRKKPISKLVNLAGLHHLIPISEILRITSSVKIPTDKTAISTQSLNEDHIYKEELEVAPKQLRNMENIVQLLGLPKNRNLTFLEEVEKHSNSIVFKNCLGDLVPGKEYLSSTSEPLSATVIINTRLETGEERDAFSISFDIVLQAGFIRIFRQYPDLYRPIVAERIVRIWAADFAEKGMQLLKGLLKRDGDILYFSHGKQIRLTAASNLYPGRPSTYFDFIEELVKDNEGKLRKLNAELGYPPDDFDPRLPY